MVQNVTPRFRQAASRGGELLTKITCTPPAGEPVVLDWEGGSVTCDMSSASRYTAQLQLPPSSEFDVFGLVTTPGAAFAVDTGFNFGAGYTETVGLGRYELAQDGSNLFEGGVSIDLIDYWARIERDKYDGPFAPASALRSTIIATAVSQVLPWVQIKILATGGTYAPTDLSWESRTELINSMAKDGGLDCYFDGSGAFVIRPEPTISTGAPVWSFKTGDESNIVTADRSRPFDRLYNRVVVLPMDESQTWAAQIVELTDVNHPLHKSRYGRSTYTYRSPALSTAAAAFSAASTILQRVHGSPETLSVGSFGMAALEAGDTVSVVTEGADTVTPLAAVHMLESFGYDLSTAALTASTRSVDQAEIDEAA